MGNQQSEEPARTRIEARIGKLPLSGRYHKAPRTVEADYELEETVLGSGYNGSVRRATKKREVKGNPKKYAVKSFKLVNVPQSKKEELASEVEIFLSMDHPHVAQLCDVYETAETLYLVMECMLGGELFDRVSTLKRFNENDAADATWQMLLALNYIHTHGIVHRDIKLENFLYDSKEGDHLKLIDFGFSKVWDVNTKMHVSCGTLSYVAPEVLAKSYTSQCDLWSLGIIVFILLSGYMPFSGPEHLQIKAISDGKANWKPHRWGTVSEKATEFVTSLLTVDPKKRLTAEQALEHPFIANRNTRKACETVDLGVVADLRSFAQATKFKRACMSMMAWSLSNEERATVRQYFIEMDVEKTGSISLQDLRTIMVERFHVPDAETKRIFEALDANNDEEIHYSDFLAAMVSSRIQMHDDLLRSAFCRFDIDGDGYISQENLREVLGDTYDGSTVDSLLGEADFKGDGKVSYAEFAAYLRGGHASQFEQEAADAMIGSQLSRLSLQGPGAQPTYQKGRPPPVKLKGNKTPLRDKSSTRATKGSNGSDEKKQSCCCIC